MKFTSLVLAFALFSCSSNDTKLDVELSNLHQQMQGSFNSENQSIQESSYFNISLHMYSIWEDKGYFLYVEQALNSMQDKPYRQRIYELKRTSDSTITSYIYKIPNDSLWVGEWKNENAFSTLSSDSLMLLDGCEVVLKKVGEKHYKGATGEKTCESVFNGASYAMSEVEITQGKVYSWDRGFDSEGNHIWGAEKGGYIFNLID
jgi:hypothetical protein